MNTPDNREANAAIADGVYHVGGKLFLTSGVSGGLQLESMTGRSSKEMTKPGNQPWVDVIVSTQDETGNRADFASYEVIGRGNGQMALEVSLERPGRFVDSPYILNAHTIAEHLGPKLAEHLHKNRVAKIAALGAAAVLAAGFAKAGGIVEGMSEIGTYVSTLATYALLRVAGKFSPTRWTRSSKPSHDYAHSIGEDVVEIMKRRTHS